MNDHDGDSPEASDLEGSARRDAINVERAAAETDQDLSDADQTLSGTDQVLAEQDQAQSDADQAASDRDQAASDLELVTHNFTDKIRAAHAASEQERRQTSEARQARAATRSGSMLARAKNAEKRDEVAKLRDMQAQVRDRTAELRDKASDDHERALGLPSGLAAKARVTAAEDRRRAADDRKRAAEDRKRAAEDREHALEEVHRAEMDDLTGFYRSRLGSAVLQHEIDRAVRSGAPLVFLYFDIDGLKQVNDTLGHDEGNLLLEAFARAIRTRLRSYDPVVRVGGDEFVCALPGIDADQARRVAGDVQKALGEAYAGASMSYGLSSIEPGDTVATMIKRGDEALRTYKAAH